MGNCRFRAAVGSLLIFFFFFRFSFFLFLFFVPASDDVTI